MLRLSHRYIRDDRATTHLFLVARAFGANKITYSGQRDIKLEERIEKVTKIWGGPFNVVYEKDWKSLIEKWKEKGGEVIHLTIYGLPIKSIIEEIRKSIKDKLVIVGGAKVPNLVYALSDWNISITSQPHSEISALGIFLHELFSGEERKFENVKLKIIPQSKGKRVLKI